MRGDLGVHSGQLRAAAAEFLLSAPFVTGTDLLIDGGTIAALKSGVYESRHR